MHKPIQHALLTDEEIIRQVLPEQPNQCFESLYNRYVNKVYRRCLSMTNDSERAQDYTHDIFLKVFNKLGSFQERASFSTWLYSISYNYCADQLRMNRKLPFSPINDSLTDELSDPEDDHLHEETLMAMRQAISALTTEEQQLLKSKYEDMLNIETLARQYAITPSAVKMRLKRCRDKIKQAYYQTCP